MESSTHAMTEILKVPIRIVHLLIDADGYLFRLELLERGSHGGKEAALRLESNIRAVLKATKVPSPEMCYVSVELFCNKPALDRTLVEKRQVSSPDILRRFWEGFKSQKSHWGIMDCTSRKEGADSSLKARVVQYLRQPCSEMILVGCCHDGGYITSMLDFFRAEEAVGRVYLLKAIRLASAFQDLSMPFVEFPDVFPSCRDLTANNIIIYPEPIQMSWGETSKRRKDRRGKDDNRQLRKESAVGPQQSQHNDVHHSKEDHDIHQVKEVDSIHHMSEPPAFVNKAERFASKEVRNGQDAWFDLQGNRLDVHQFEVVDWILVTLNDRYIENNNVCLDFILNGACQEAHCGRDHRCKYASKLIDTSRSLYYDREAPCEMGPACRDFACQFSHHCPFLDHQCERRRCPYRSRYTISGDCLGGKYEQIKRDFEARKFDTIPACAIQHVANTPRKA